MEYYSQFSQDKYLNEMIFKGKREGVFVDIGAHDDVSLSNSYFLEKNLGWKGICVEPIPDVYKHLRHNRSCICVEGAISSHEG